MDDDLPSYAGEDNSVVIDFPGELQHDVRELEDDDEYSGECGYWIVIMFRGKNTGRKLKRIIGKAAFVELVCGFIFFVITLYETYNFALSEYFNAAIVGIPLIQLMWLVSIPSVLASMFFFLMVKYWATLVTNRLILIYLMRVSMVIVVLLLATICWCISALIIVFRGVRFMVRFKTLFVVLLFVSSRLRRFKLFFLATYAPCFSSFPTLHLMRFTC